MNGNDILDAVARADEKYISGSENYNKIQAEFQTARSKKIKTVSAVCLCAAFAAGAVFIMRGINTKPALPDSSPENSMTDYLTDMDQNATSGSDTTVPVTKIIAENKQVTVPDLPPTNVAEVYQVPRWDERSELEKFVELTVNSTVYLGSGHETNDMFFAEPLGTATVKGFDVYTETEHKEEVSVFALRDISSACAVGVKFKDGVCTAYHNQNYTPQTLGQFINDLGLKNYLTFGKAYAFYFDSDNNYHTVFFDDFEDAPVWEILLSDSEIKNTPDVHRSGDNLADIAVNLPVLGIENYGMWFTEDGYLCSNVLATLKCFYIGTEKTKAMADYLYANVSYTDELPFLSENGAGEPETAAVDTTEVCVSGGYIPE